MTDLDLDALEREAQGDLDIEGYRVVALIQRLRETKADRDEWKQKAWDGLAGGNIVALGMQTRISQLERVREAAIGHKEACRVWFTGGRNAQGVDDSLKELDAALAAVEEK